MSRRRLVVNVDHVATLREARGGREPDPVAAATLATLAGADGIVVHLRGDRRHIQERDARLLRPLIRRCFCVEMAATAEGLSLALDLRPDSVTLVPERSEERSTERGLDLRAQAGTIGELVAKLRGAGIRSCLFVDPDRESIEAAGRLRADAIEIHTGVYAGADESGVWDAELARIFEAARLAAGLDLEVGVGHGLDYENVRPLAEGREIVEFSIGHSIVSRAVLVGMERAVREMRALVG
ncbi:MAG: pyridoxine 5'-phosphate synthase [Myxococcota bacterium]